MVAPGLLTGRGWATAVALTVSVWLLALTPAAESHVVAGARPAGTLKLDPTEVAVLGI
jgi:hypothetical protein